MSEHIRRVEPDETMRLAEIGELTALAYLSDGLVDRANPYVPQLKDAAARAEHAILLMMSDGDDGQGAAVGTLTVVPPGSQFAELAGADEFELRMLAVSPLARGRGIGALLTKAGMQLAVDQGAERIVLSTMESMHIAHRLYERLGFTRREDLDWTAQDGDDAAVDEASGVRLLGYAWEPGKAS